MTEPTHALSFQITEIKYKQNEHEKQQIQSIARRSLLAALGINLALASSLTFTHQANAAKIGVVVNTTGATFYLAWAARLAGQGHTVTIVPQATSAATVAAANYALLIVSSDVTSAGFRAGPGISQSVPYLIYEQALYGDFFGGAGGTPTGNTITITNATHPLAAGLSGAQVIAIGTPTIPTSQGARSANCTLVATFGSDISLLCLEPNLSNGTTSFSARRIGVPVYATWTSNQVTAAGWQILDGAVSYALTPPPPPPQKTWNGAGDGGTMTSGANWVGGVAPVAGDRLIFGGTTGLAPNNDYPANTAFNGIIFTNDAGAFTISGSEINLTSGITNNSAHPQTISANLNNTANMVHSAATADLIYTGVVKNNRINKQGINGVWLMGTPDNTGTLGCDLNQGTVFLAKTGGANIRALSGSVTVNTNGTLRVYGPGQDQLYYDKRITMNGGVLQVANTNGLVSPAAEEIGSLSCTNALSSIVENGLPNSTNRLDLGGGFGGRRSIYGGIIRDGAGVLNLRIYRYNNSYIFNGSNTYTGTTTVQNNDGAGVSRMILNGAHVGGGSYSINSSSAANGALLGGKGSISAAVANFGANSFLSPGGDFTSEADNSTVSETTGILTFSNAVNLIADTATLDVQLNGTTAGSGYDQVVIAGSGTFSNNYPNLKPTLGFTPAIGNKFTIVKVQGSDSAANVGVFAALNGVPTDLSQGTTFVEPVTGKNLRISYRAEGSTFDAGEGLGNDIMLEVVAPPRSEPCLARRHEQRLGYHHHRQLAHHRQRVQHLQQR